MAANVRPFFELLSETAGYTFDDSDWNAVAFGIADTDAEGAEARWYSYPLVGSRSRLDVTVAIDQGADVVLFKVTARRGELPEAEVATIAAVLSGYALHTPPG